MFYAGTYDAPMPMTLTQVVLAWLVCGGLIVAAIVALRRKAPDRMWPVATLAGLAIWVPAIGFHEVVSRPYFPGTTTHMHQDPGAGIITLGSLILTSAIAIAAGWYLGSLRGDVPRHAGLIVGFAIGALLLPVFDRFGEPTVWSNSCFGSCPSWYPVFYWFFLVLRVVIGLLPALIACAISKRVHERRDRRASLAEPSVEGAAEPG